MKYEIGKQKAEVFLPRSKKPLMERVYDRLFREAARKESNVVLLAESIVDAKLTLA